MVMQFSHGQRSCAECTIHGRKLWGNTTECEYYLGRGRSTAPADLSLFIGLGTGHRDSQHTGERVYHPELLDVFESGFVSSCSYNILLSTRRISHYVHRIRDTFPVHHVVQYSEFPKPLARESIQAIEALCGYHKPQNNAIIYVGRYTSGKGEEWPRPSQ